MLDRLTDLFLHFAVVMVGFLEHTVRRLEAFGRQVVGQGRLNITQIGKEGSEFV
jgi:hypothetical protein